MLRSLKRGQQIRSIQRLQPFSSCSTRISSQEHCVANVPKYHTWNVPRKVFYRRKQCVPATGYDVPVSDARARVYTLHPNKTECYYLRLLLHTVREPTSFTDLKTVNGEVCETYRESARGWVYSKMTNTGTQLCRERVLQDFHPNSWKIYKQSLSEDLLREQRRVNPNIDLNFSSQIFNQALILIEDRCLAISCKAWFKRFNTQCC